MHDTIVLARGRRERCVLHMTAEGWKQVTTTNKTPLSIRDERGSHEDLEVRIRELKGMGWRFKCFG